VVDKAAGEKGVVVGVDLDRVHLRLARVLDALHGVEAVARVHDGQDHPQDGVILELVDDPQPLGLPPLDPIEIVLGQPLSSAAAPVKVQRPAHIVRNKWHVVTAQSVWSQRRTCEQVPQQRLLGTQETDARSECPDVAQADTTRRYSTDPLARV